MRKNKYGFSLIEILVVMSVFAIIGVVASQAVLTTLRGARRADSESVVRQNIDYVFSIMERQLRNATRVTCPNPQPTRIDFVDPDGTAQYFALTGNYVSFSNNASRLTSSDVVITALNITCDVGVGSGTDKVNISLTGQDAYASGAEQASITNSISVSLRTSK
jgi:prepilin-type N-terminal cleavage/methylation domain-containing protein